MRPHVVHWLEGFLPANVASTIAPSWFTMVGLAGVVTLLVMMARARKNQIDPGVIASAVSWCYVIAVAAGIAMPMLIDAVQHRIATGEVVLRWSGMTSFWGYLAGMGAVAIVCRDHGVPLARMGDLATAPLGLALAFARVGCFLGGCDYGKVTSLPWAVRFPAGSPAWQDHVAAGLVPAERGASLPVHPTQLYEAMLGIVLAAIAIVIARRPWARARDGRVFLAGAALYALGRIGVEALRGDAGRGIYLGLSSGQIFSLIVLAAIGLGTIATRRRALHAIATAAMVLAIALPHRAHAQPGADLPAPTPAPAPVPPPAGPPPASPPPPQLPPEYTPPQNSRPQLVQPQYIQRAARPAGQPRYEVGALIGAAFPVNRRGDQVPPLAGPSLSVGFAFGVPSFWIDLDSYGNNDASHGTLLFSAGLTGHLGNLAIGGRLGIGPTLVNFDDPVFRDVMGTTIRVEALGEYAVSNAWAIWFRPITIDTLAAADLGGPITSYQIRAGVAFRFGGRPAQPAVIAPQQPPQPYYQPQQPQPRAP